jgi:hypothetical protein
VAVTSFSDHYITSTPYSTVTAVLDMKEMVVLNFSVVSINEIKFLLGDYCMQSARSSSARDSGLLACYILLVGE